MGDKHKWKDEEKVEAIPEALIQEADRTLYLTITFYPRSDDNIPKFLQHKKLYLSTFSYGCFSGLTNFVEHLRLPTRAKKCAGLQQLTGYYQLQSDWQHDERSLHVLMTLKHAEKCAKALKSGYSTTSFRLDIYYSMMHRILIHFAKNGGTEIFLFLRHPPLLKEAVNRPKSFDSEDAEEEEFNRAYSVTWLRCLDLGCQCTDLVPTRLVGGCLVLRLGYEQKYRPKLINVIGRLNQRCLKMTEFHFVPSCRIRLDKRDAAEVKMTLEELMKELSYANAYALLAIIHLTEDLCAQICQMSQEDRNVLYRFLREAHSIDAQALEKTLYDVWYAIDNGNIVGFPEVFLELFERFRHRFQKFREKKAALKAAGDGATEKARDELEREAEALGQLGEANGTCSIRRVFYTPSRIILMVPQVHSENRVLRNYDSEYALRVTFREDSISGPLTYSLPFNVNAAKSFLARVVGDVLINGLEMLDRKFDFLGCSCSQLRDHGCWMYAKDPKGFDAAQIRDAMGYFTVIRNVAKQMARMGQCFSSTEATIRVPKEYKRTIEDIKGGPNDKYTFSDGIGQISQELAEQVYSKMKLKTKPSAFQIRYAGTKGMVCINPLLEGKSLKLRDSMVKFLCDEDQLEVIKTSAPRVVTLNRPLICILEQLGVLKEVFLHLQESMIVEYTDSLVYDDSAVTMLSQWHRQPIPFKRLVEEGRLSLTHDPFFRSLLMAVYRNAVGGLRNKARIAIPFNKGRNMLGVLDETGTLQYGQVFIQYTELSTEAGNTPLGTKVLEGMVVVTKCPCLHPGDVRKFQAVDVEALYHIVDCIVFPSVGPRPHPDEMAGSDLDGDEYVALWDKRLFFVGDNYPPMDYSSSEVKQKKSEITVLDMIEFLCDYIRTDAVGRMSNAHLAFADKEDKGIFSDQCISIAKKIPMCLDFAKTGAEFEVLKRDEKPKLYPDFMEKHDHKNTYRSTRALGYLYRACRSLQSAVSMGRQSIRATFCENLEFEGWKQFEDQARVALTVYNNRLDRIMQQYQIDSEGEVLACLIVSEGRYHMERGTDKTNVETLIERQSEYLVTRTRKIFEDELNADGGQRDSIEMRMLRRYQKASAWYMVCYAYPDDSAKHYYSFPWIVADVLADIIDFNIMRLPPTVRRMHSSPLIDKLDGVIKAEFPSNDDDCSLRGFRVIEKWARKEELLDAENSPMCSTCLLKVFQRATIFQDLPKLYGNQEITPGVEVVHFLRFCSTEKDLNSVLVTNDVSEERSVCGRCDVTRDARLQTNRLQMAAQRVYSMVAVTTDFCHLGLPCDRELHEPFQEISEGEPVRLRLWEGSKLHELVMNDFEKVRDSLQRWSGVKTCHIRVEPNRREWYAIVTSEGRDWQRWTLEELLLQPWLADAIEKGSVDQFLQKRGQDISFPADKHSFIAEPKK